MSALPDPERFHEAAIAFGASAVVVFTVNQGVAVELAGIGGLFELAANKLERRAPHRPTVKPPQVFVVPARPQVFVVPALGSAAAGRVVISGTAGLGPAITGSSAAL